MMAVTKTLRSSVLIPVICYILAIIPPSATAQNSWDSTYRPDIFVPRISFFKTFPKSASDIIFIGDSITFWGDWPELFQNKNIKNRGIPGDISFGLLERLKHTIEGKPERIFILIGINDLARNIPDSVIINNHKRLISEIKLSSPETKIFVQSILPTNSEFKKLTNHYNKEDRIRMINTSLKQIARDFNVDFIDLYSVFSDTNGKLKSQYTWDGVHLTADGYTAWADVLIRLGYLKH